MGHKLLERSMFAVENKGRSLFVLYVNNVYFVELAVVEWLARNRG